MMFKRLSAIFICLILFVLNAHSEIPKSFYLDDIELKSLKKIDPAIDDFMLYDYDGDKRLELIVLYYFQRVENDFSIIALYKSDKNNYWNLKSQYVDKDNLPCGSIIENIFSFDITISKEQDIIKKYLKNKLFLKRVGNNMSIFILNIVNLNFSVCGTVFNLAGIVCDASDKNKIYLLDYSYMGPYINDSFIEGCYNDHNFKNESDFGFLNDDLYLMYKNMTFAYFDQNNKLIEQDKFPFTLINAIQSVKVNKLKERKRIIDFLHLFWFSFIRNKSILNDNWIDKHIKYITDYSGISKEGMVQITDSLRKKLVD